MRLIMSREKAHIVTFGCQMNRQESGVMAALLGRAGYMLTERIEEAGLVVIETCAIRDRAEHKVFSLLGRLNKRRREEGVDLRIALCGCIATDGTAETLVRRHGVDVVLGPRRIARIAEAVASSRAAPVIDLGMEWLLPPEEIPAPDAPGVSAFVTVMQGCSNACSFCVVPARRGPVQSRPAEAILREIENLERAGYREVTLIGQNVSTWGRDLGGRMPSRPAGAMEGALRRGGGRMPSRPAGAMEGALRRGGRGEQLLDLLERVEAGCGIPRIRFATSHPAYIDARFIEGFGRLRRVMPYLHLPVQSGADGTLVRMRRGYDAARYREIAAAIRAARPGTAIMTDLIAGFDGETEADHRATLELIRAVGFDGVYAFAYSERPGTAAAGGALGDPVSPEVRLERCREILAVAEETALARRRSDVGATVEVLVEREGVGRDPRNILTSFAGRGEPGEFVAVRVERVAAYALFGGRA
jgi:tRNA-2-methylthio-N6-dimethylallyladenosine synthase